MSSYIFFMRARGRNFPGIPGKFFEICEKVSEFKKSDMSLCVGQRHGGAATCDAERRSETFQGAVESIAIDLIGALYSL